MSLRNFQDWVRLLRLQPHPEGGFFAESYRAPETIPHHALPVRFKGDRSFCTGIYYLLNGGHVSAFHRIASDEMWHFYDGCSLSIEVIQPTGEHTRIVLGPDVEAGERLQAVVPAGCWFGAALTHHADDSDYALVGCTVAPGFDFADFEMADREQLIARFPQHKKLIISMTRDHG